MIIDLHQQIAIADQIKSAWRELAMRRSTYPRLVASGKMRGADADKELAAMAAIVDTLMAVAMDAEFAGSTRG